MKTSLVLLVIVFLVGCNRKPEYHLMVKLFYVNSMDSSLLDYAVYFTNNGWFTKHTLNTAFDISWENNPVNVVEQPALFDNCKTAEAFALRFNNYQKCLAYNDSIHQDYSKQLSFRKLHPIPPTPKQSTIIECQIKNIY